ncbi:hypothetical protein CLCR_11006 [Cladophialophora carrionii]|uniref:GPI anchored protein n=1 Tax=Cladophialophora carrionii TaxID=86049 RepID=A0A1C1CZA9_9EURO|nr:hypothetical protein CLCR_11006 [Cladophialophora carrionii]
MRIHSAFGAILLFLTSLALATLPPGDWSGETTITVTASMSTTHTVTKYLTYANATTTSSSSSVTPTAWNVTSSYLTGASTVHSPALTASVSATSSVFPPIASATGAASSLEMNLAVAGLAGAAALFWGSL